MTINPSDSDGRVETPPSPESDPTRLSRFLALVLRHRAYRFDLRLDDEGFVFVDELLEVIRDQPGLEWVGITDLEEVTDGEHRRRYEIRDNKMRATYGHSFRKPVMYPHAEPPESLFFGVPKNQQEAVRVEGLKPTNRQYIHLSANREEAEAIAGRSPEPSEVISISALKASQSGVVFHNPTADLFLCKSIPAEFLDIKVSYGRRTRRGKRR